MKLFSATQMSWSEPLFFVVRLRERAGWARRGVLLLGIAVLIFLAMYFTRNPRPGLGYMLGISLAAGTVLVALLDVGAIQREVTIKDDSIIYNSAVGTMWMGSFALNEIQRIHLMRAREDWSKPYGAMLVQTSDDGFLLGVPNKVSLETIANVLHRLGVAVQLSGWEPSEADTRVQVKDEIALPQGAARGTGEARIWAVEPSEPRLNPPLVIAIGLTLALGPLLLSFLGLIGAAVYLYLKWGELATLDKCLIGGGAFAALVLSFVYLVFAGQFLASRYSIGVARKVLRTRPNARISGEEEGLVPVEIFDRAAWTSTIVKSADYGFVQIDSRLGCLKFEGDKTRWDIPATALTACRIEEAHVGSEGNQNAEKRYYVVIVLNREGQPWETGIVHTRTELGSDGSQQRYARAQALLQRISAIVSAAS